MRVLSGQLLEHTKKITFQAFFPLECVNWLAPAVWNRISTAAISPQTICGQKHFHRCFLLSQTDCCVKHLNTSTDGNDQLSCFALLNLLTHLNNGQIY